MKPEQEGLAFVAIKGVDLAEILCIQEERQVANDNTVAFNRHRLQIPPNPLRVHFFKARVKTSILGSWQRSRLENRCAGAPPPTGRIC